MQLVEYFSNLDSSLENNGNSFQKFGNIIVGIGLAISGLALAIMSLPVAITGAVVVILGVLAGMWDEIKTGFQQDICTSMFIVALFTITMIWKQPKCPSMNE